MISFLQSVLEGGGICERGKRLLLLLAFDYLWSIAVSLLQTWQVSVANTLIDHLYTPQTPVFSALTLPTTVICIQHST